MVPDYNSRPLAINNHSTVLVEGTGWNGLYFTDGTQELFPTVPGLSPFTLTALNDDNWVTATDIARAGFLWDGEWHDLNSLAVDSPGTITTAVGISNTDSIIGLCSEPSGVYGVLLTPVPEPVTVSLLSLGGLAMLRRAKTK